MSGNKAPGAAQCEVWLDETSSEANGAAYLVHMLLGQKAESDTSGCFAAEAARLRPVRLFLRDTQEGAIVSWTARRLTVSSDLRCLPVTSIVAESIHVIAVTKVALAGRFLLIGPPTDKEFRRLVRDIATRRVVIKGIVAHYLNTMRFLWLVNLRSA